MNCRELIKKDEGLRLKAYKDTEGNLTIGYGLNLATFDESDAEYFLSKRILGCTDYLNQFLWYKRLDDIRKSAIVNMCYNIGIHKFSEFTTFIDFLKAVEYEKAADDLLATEAAKQLPARYGRLAKMLKTGDWPKDY